MYYQILQSKILEYIKRKLLSNLVQIFRLCNLIFFFFKLLSDCLYLKNNFKLQNNFRL